MSHAREMQKPQNHVQLADGRERAMTQAGLGKITLAVIPRWNSPPILDHFICGMQRGCNREWHIPRFQPPINGITCYSYIIAWLHISIHTCACVLKITCSKTMLLSLLPPSNPLDRFLKPPLRNLTLDAARGSDPLPPWTSLYGSQGETYALREWLESKPHSFPGGCVQDDLASMLSLSWFQPPIGFPKGCSEIMAPG